MNMPKIQTLACLAKAAGNPDNTNKDGTINWDYVSADVYIDMNPVTKEERKFIDEMVDSFADGYEYRTRIGVKKDYV